MRARKKAKLALDRETLVALDARVLDAIAGGADDPRTNLSGCTGVCCPGSTFPGCGGA